MTWPKMWPDVDGQGKAWDRILTESNSRHPDSFTKLVSERDYASFRCRDYSLMVLFASSIHAAILSASLNSSLNSSWVGTIMGA